MKKQDKFGYTLKILCSSIEILEKNKIQVNGLENHVKKAKFKILHNVDTNSRKSINTFNINQRDLLKILYISNFEETLEPNSLNRASCNLLQLLKENIDKLTSDIWWENSIFRNIYSQTLSINILYTVYKIKNLDED
jgi:hypothetical protein